MGQRGPAPKPTGMKLLQGTYRADRAAPNEPRPEPKALPCPSHLKGAARKEWNRLATELAAVGVLTALDLGALEAYCQAYAEYREMEKLIAKNGRIQIAESGYASPRPEVTMRDRALARMKEFGAQLGLTPASRTRVSAHAPKPKGNPFLDAANG